MPAKLPAVIPIGISSNTRHSSGLTPSFFAASRYISGAGFPAPASQAVVIASKYSATPSAFNTPFIRASELLEAMPARMWSDFRRARNSFAPFFHLTSEVYLS